MVGRAAVFRDFKEMFEEAEIDGRAPRARVLCGPRGVGKTSVLTEVADTLPTRDWIWAAIEVEVPANGRFADRLLASLEELEGALGGGPRKGLRLTGSTLKVSAGIGSATANFERQPGESADVGLGGRLQDAVGRVVSAGGPTSGLLICLDEGHLSAAEDLNALGQMLQRGRREHWPVTALVAGLPELRRKRESTTYFRDRARWFEMPVINRDEAVRGLSEPASDAGRPFTQEALEFLVDEAGTYPYTIQLYGSYAWRRSVGQPQIDLESASFGARDAALDLRDGLLENRWGESGETQKAYLGAVAVLSSDGRKPTGPDVASFLGASSSKLSMARNSLLQRGYLQVGQTSALEFVIPVMRQFVLDKWSLEVGGSADELHENLRAAAVEGLQERSDRLDRDA